MQSLSRAFIGLRFERCTFIRTHSSPFALRPFSRIAYLWGCILVYRNRNNRRSLFLECNRPAGKVTRHYAERERERETGQRIQVTPRGPSLATRKNCGTQWRNVGRECLLRIPLIIQQLGWYRIENFLDFRFARFRRNSSQIKIERVNGSGSCVLPVHVRWMLRSALTLWSINFMKLFIRRLNILHTLCRDELYSIYRNCLLPSSGKWIL